MEIAKKLLNFIDESPTAFHVVNNTEKILIENNFIKLEKNQKWNLEKNKSYYIINESSALVAFTLDEDLEKGFNIIASHTDSPLIKIKPNSEVITEGHYVSLNTEVYGGPNIESWFDRGLSIAGKVIIKENEELKTCFIDAKKPLLTIPSVAIHLVRDKERETINRQKHLKPILSFVKETLKEGDYVYKVIEEQLKCDKKDILDFELYLYDTQKGEIFGLNDEFIQSKYLDDLVMVYTSTIGFINSKINKSKILLLTDNEEIGSNSAVGANSVFFENVIERIFLSLNKDKEDYFISISNSSCLSGDLAHGYHPNYKDKTDETNRPLLGKGITIKQSANRSYSTECFQSSKFKNELRKRNIAFQDYVNRSDIKGGSTIGPMISKKFGISAIDAGCAIFSMHSVRETASVYDINNVLEALICFYEMQ